MPQSSQRSGEAWGQLGPPRGSLWEGRGSLSPMLGPPMLGPVNASLPVDWPLAWFISQGLETSKEVNTDWYRRRHTGQRGACCMMELCHYLSPK
jgi:hypothetical protein